VRLRPTVVFPLCVGVALALGGCSGSNSSTANDPVTSAHLGAGSTTAPLTNETATRPGADSLVVRFDAPGDVSCTGDTTTITVTYATVDLTAVGFVVDNHPVVGATAPPTSGDYSIALPCDGNVHTLQLVGSGPSGPAFASKAVATRRT
jgi:hypothetical protein